MLALSGPGGDWNVRRMLAFCAVGIIRTTMADKFAHPRAHSDAAHLQDALQRARFALHSRRPRDAEQIAGELRKTHPHDPRVVGIFGNSLLMQGRAADAIAV